MSMQLARDYTVVVSAHLVELQRRLSAHINISGATPRNSPVAWAYLVELATDRGVVDVAVAGNEAGGGEKSHDGLHCLKR